MTTENNKAIIDQAIDAFEAVVKERDQLKAEVARLHEKYDHQYLVKQNEELKAELHELQIKFDQENTHNPTYKELKDVLKECVEWFDGLDTAIYESEMKFTEAYKKSEQLTYKQVDECMANVQKHMESFSEMLTKAQEVLG